MPRHPSSEACAASPTPNLVERLNGAWHERALQAFTVVVLAHWAEHLAQAFQIWVLGWPTADSRGVLGLWYPWMVESELLHYAYALVMLVGLWVLRSGFAGRSHRYWKLALAIQFWHHLEHALLQGQAILGRNLLDRPVPTSLVQIWIPRVELHLFYNSVVFLPMVIAMYYHLFPSDEERAETACACAWTPSAARG